MSGNNQIVINFDIAKEEARPVPWRHIDITLDTSLPRDVPVTVTTDGHIEVHGPFDNLVDALEFTNQLIDEIRTNFEKEVNGHEQPDTPE